MHHKDDHTERSDADARDIEPRQRQHDAPEDPELIGQTAGGVGGTVAGAAIGSLAGPLGTVIGGIAGAVGGWWTGRAITQATERFDTEEDRYFREHYASSDVGLADRSYEDVRPAYQLGYIAAHNPEYQGRKFEEIEEDLRKGWNDDLQRRYGDWSRLRRYAEASYIRRMYRAPGGPAAMGATSTRPPL